MLFFHVLAENRHGLLVATDGGIDGVEKKIVSQKIEYTDFSLNEITLYLENGVLKPKGERQSE